MALRGFVTGWAALGVVLTGATQLRAGGVPLGPGELLLAAWVLFVVFLLLVGLNFKIGNALKIMLIYWLISWTLMGFGTIIAISMSRLETNTAIHDIFAFLFLTIISCLLSLNLNNKDSHYHGQLASLAFFILAFCSTLLLAIAMIVPRLGPIDFWWAYRFRGWAENPNQMALLMLGMPFLGWHLLRRSRRSRHRIAYTLAIGCCVLVGVATASDGLRIAWAVTLGGLGVLAWYRAVLLRARGAVMYLSHLALPLLAVVLGYTFGDELVAQLERVSQETYEEGGQGSVRTTLWSHGIEAILRSPLVGFGPGSYSGLYGPFEGYEAHNMLIDWGMSTGGLGVLLHVGLLLLIAWRAFKANSLALLGLVASLIMFGMSAYILRQPIYWLLLVLSLTFTERPGSAAAAAASALRSTPNRYTSRHAPLPGERPRAALLRTSPGTGREVSLSSRRSSLPSSNVSGVGEPHGVRD